MKKLQIISAVMALLMIFLTACGQVQKTTDENSAPANETVSYADAQVITLSDDSASLDGTAIEEFDYTWHCDPSTSHDEVKDAPAEYYTGTKPQTDSAAYIDHELFYFPALDENGFKLQNYDGENEWTYNYTDGEHDEFIFATLPNLGNSLPTQMMHTEDEAAANKVLHITKAGTYVLEGKWNGQIWIDLGDKDETFTAPDAKVTLVMNGADINCTVAPGVVFRNAYECDNSWEDQTAWSADVDTTDAGVTVVLADGTENTVTGTNVFRMLKTVYKDENSTDEVKVQKKLRKTDAAFYSYVSMNIAGNGALTVNSAFEGMDSELHLSINSGNITINSQDDGMNVNEDHVSVICFNGGNVTINPAQGAEGDGVDSNGYIAINGGTVSVNGVRVPDSALDSEDGVYYNSGTVIIDGEEQNYTAGSVIRESGGMGQPPQMGEMPTMPNAEDFDLEKFKEDVAELDDDATLEDVMGLLGLGNMRGNEPNRPDDMGEAPTDRPEPPVNGGNMGGGQPPEIMQ